MSEIAEAAEAPRMTALPWAGVPAAAGSSEFVDRAVRHLREDVVVWVTTVSPGGQPSPNPVWFLWDGGATLRMFCAPDSVRVRNIRDNPRVSLNFGGDGRGLDIVVLNGVAEIDPEGPAATDFPELIAKYGPFFPQARLTPEDYAAYYSVPVVVRLTQLRGV
jgi:PPOX class probable F420-dependent enzyme